MKDSLAVNYPQTLTASTDGDGSAVRSPGIDQRPDAKQNGLSGARASPEAEIGGDGPPSPISGSGFPTLDERHDQGHKEAAGVRSEGTGRDEAKQRGVQNPAGAVLAAKGHGGSSDGATRADAAASFSNLDELLPVGDHYTEACSKQGLLYKRTASKASSKFHLRYFQLIVRATEDGLTAEIQYGKNKSKMQRRIPLDRPADCSVAKLNDGTDVIRLQCSDGVVLEVKGDTNDETCDWYAVIDEVIQETCDKTSRLSVAIDAQLSDDAKIRSGGDGTAASDVVVAAPSDRQATPQAEMLGDE